ncbi:MULTISPECIES: hypothetical protein [Paenibacillus]|uniref:hypothetical protein n=1 Tax=Paenibacillus TaxID=44249 RepID=UPI0013D1C8DA|nr:hypothetical protein [Paenibacillus sp. ALJ109b]NEU62314.1 hypothetical protein [Paenibacillus sp. ALJ109b]
MQVPQTQCEAIEVEQAGLKVRMKNTAEYSVPEQLQQQFDEKSNPKRKFHE